MRRLTISAAIALALTGAAMAQDAGKDGAGLPGGSSSLQETFEDWTVRCAVQGDARVCTLQQQQRHRESGQLVLAVELQTGKDGALTGAAVLPFGLKLAQGVTLQVDEQAASTPLPFSTCLPVGCLVPLTLDTAYIDALRGATALKITAKANENDSDVSLSVSLKGVAAAHDRLTALGAN